MLPRTNVAKPRNVPHDKLSRSFFDGWKIDTDRCSPSVENRVETMLLILASSSLAINTLLSCLLFLIENHQFYIAQYIPNNHIPCLMRYLGFSNNTLIEGNCVDRSSSS